MGALRLTFLGVSHFEVLVGVEATIWHGATNTLNMEHTRLAFGGWRCENMTLVVTRSVGASQLIDVGLVYWWLTSKIHAQRKARDQ